MLACEPAETAGTLGGLRRNPDDEISQGQILEPRRWLINCAERRQA
jgi:hypothetical protein